jgi:hypothetical protein
MLDVERIGDANQLLTDEAFFRKTVRRFAAPLQEQVWGGWLGRYQARLASITAPPSLHREPIETER